MLNRLIDALADRVVERMAQSTGGGPLVRVERENVAVRTAPLPIPPLDMERFGALSVGAGLKKLLDPQKHFCIIAFDQLCATAGVLPMPGVRNRLRSLHCIDWRDMDPELRGQVYAAIKATFLVD